MKIKARFYTSYRTHNFCSNCDNNYKTGWILKVECFGNYCPNCGKRLRTKPKWNKGSIEVKRY